MYFPLEFNSKGTETKLLAHSRWAMNVYSMKKGLQSWKVPDLGLELRRSDSRNPAFDLHIVLSLLVYKVVYFVACGILLHWEPTSIAYNVLTVWAGFIHASASSFMVTKVGTPRCEGEPSWAPSCHHSAAKGGPNCRRYDLLPPDLSWPSLALVFVILCQELAKGKIPEDRQSSGWKVEKLIICFWREFSLLFSSDCCSRLFTGWWKKVEDFRCTAIWHSLSPGLMPRWVSAGWKSW